MVRMRMPEGSSFARSREMCTSIALAEISSFHDATAPAILSLPTIASTLENRYSRIACSRCERSSATPLTNARFLARSMVSGPCSIKRDFTARPRDMTLRLYRDAGQLATIGTPPTGRQPSRPIDIWIASQLRPETVEVVEMPREMLAICVGKSTYARCGIIVNVTPLEPEWEGHVTLEFSNTTPLPARIYANEGVAQMLFFESDEVCETSYKDRGGKYQGQKGVTLPKI